MSDYKNNRDKAYRKPKKYYEISADPIKSYGLIIFSLKENIPVFLLYQRRDNFGYLDFLRGMWSNDEQIKNLFSSMSHEERERIRNYTFDELWDDLWIEKTSKIYKDGYPKAKRKYDSIRYKIVDFLKLTTTDIIEPPWGFPKGKKNNNESSIDCAIREFKEETKLDIENINIICKKGFVETFKGSNNRLYATKYFLGYIDNPIVPEKYHTPQCIRKETISEEASQVAWFEYKDTCKYLNPMRQDMLKNILPIINEYQIHLL